jgi:hypothetical protein
MAFPDQVTGTASLTGSGQTYDIRPSAGEEWIIHNIFFNKGIQIYMTDGTNLVPLRVFAHGWFWEWLSFHVNNTRFIRLKTIRTGTTLVGFDGVQSK